MSVKNKKQYGVWLDSNHATIVGKELVESGDFVILAEAKNVGQGSNSNENTGNNAEQMLQQKFFTPTNTAHRGGIGAGESSIDEKIFCTKKKMI